MTGKVILILLFLALFQMFVESQDTSGGLSLANLTVSLNNVIFITVLYFNSWQYKTTIVWMLNLQMTQNAIIEHNSN